MQGQRKRQGCPPQGQAQHSSLERQQAYAHGTPRQQNSLACLGQEPLAVHHSNPTAYTASCGLSGGRSKHKGYQGYTVGLGNLLALPHITGYKPQTCTALTKATFKNLPLFLPGSSKTESRDKPTTLQYQVLWMYESSKLFHLDNSSDLQQHKSSVEQLKARLQGAKISYQTVENRSNQFCSAWTEVLHLSCRSKETQRCWNIIFLSC